MKMPSAAPITIASVSPAPVRHSDAAPLLMSSPSLTRSIQAVATALSGGSAKVEIRPLRAPASQASASKRSGRYRSSAAVRPATRSLTAATLGFDRLDANQVPDLVDLVDEALVLEDRGIALVEFGIDDRLDAPWPRRHDRHAIREIDCLLHVVGHEDHGLRRALPDAQQFGLHEAAGLGVERAERLVHQQDLRIEGERARNRGALPHAARQLRGVAVLEAIEPDQVDEGLRPLLAFLPRKSHSLQAVEHIAAHCLPRKQREMLKDDAAIRAGRGDRLALDEDRAGLRREETADEIEQRRLAAAGGSEQRYELTRADVERDLLEREHRPAGRRAIAMAHAIDDDLRLRHGLQPLPRQLGRSGKLAKSCGRGKAASQGGSDLPPSNDVRVIRPRSPVRPPAHRR